jgi:hypothetical protein
MSSTATRRYSIGMRSSIDYECTSLAGQDPQPRASGGCSHTSAPISSVCNPVLLAQVGTIGDRCRGRSRVVVPIARCRAVVIGSAMAIKVLPRPSLGRRFLVETYSSSRRSRVVPRGVRGRGPLAKSPSHLCSPAVGEQGYRSTESIAPPGCSCRYSPAPCSGDLWVPEGLHWQVVLGVRSGT